MGSHGAGRGEPYLDVMAADGYHACSYVVVNRSPAAGHTHNDTLQAMRLLRTCLRANLAERRSREMEQQHQGFHSPTRLLIRMMVCLLVANFRAVAVIVMPSAKQAITAA